MPRLQDVCQPAVLARFETKFPLLLDSWHDVTSSSTDQYNCIAWAAGVSTKWWWPAPKRDAYWPEAVPRECTIAAFIEAFGTQGYQPCPMAALADGFEHVAIYALDGSPTHASRQVSDVWTSKLGRSLDLSHEFHALNGPEYGEPVQLLRRPL